MDKNGRVKMGEMGETSKRATWAKWARGKTDKMAKAAKTAKKWVLSLYTQPTPQRMEIEIVASNC